MKSTTLKKSLCLLLTGMISVGAPVMAAGPMEIRSSDVALIDGIMSGTILNTAAQPVSGLNLQLLHGDKVIARAVSDENGQFAIRGLRNGGHVLQVGSVQQPVRFWGNQAAPPSAASTMAIVVDENVVRGQEGQNSSMTNNLVPLLIFGGALGATLAITLSANDPNPAPPASP